MSPADQRPDPRGARRPPAPRSRGESSQRRPGRQGRPGQGRGGSSAASAERQPVPRSVQDAAAALPGASTAVRRLGAEAIGTFVLVLGGCGAAVLAASTTTADGAPVGVGYLGVALAFGLSVLVMAYAVGPVSGGHFNPAVSVGMAVAGRFAWRDVPRYAVAQLVGAVLAALVLFAVASGRPGFDAVSSGFATNGYGDRSPGGYSLLAALLVEVVLTAVFLIIVLGATDSRAPRGMGPTAIGLGLTLVHLVSIPVTNTSVNPARSIAPALFAGGDALGQLWLFVLAPLAGAAVAGVAYAALFGRTSDITSRQATTDA